MTSTDFLGIRGWSFEQLYLLHVMHPQKAYCLVSQFWTVFLPPPKQSQILANLVYEVGFFIWPGLLFILSLNSASYNYLESHNNVRNYIIKDYFETHFRDCLKNQEFCILLPQWIVIILSDSEVKDYLRTLGPAYTGAFVNDSSNWMFVTVISHSTNMVLYSTPQSWGAHLNGKSNRHHHIRHSNPKKK